MIRFVFETTNAARIYAPVFAPNSKSRRAAEKLGMQYEGTHRSALEIRGERWDEAVYSVLRDEIR